MSAQRETDERAPLLQQRVSASDVDAAVDDEGDEGAVGSARAGEAKLFLSLFLDSIPVILSYILQNSIQTVSILITGRLGPDALSASAFACMLAYVTGLIVGVGGSTALDSLGAVAFTGGRPRDLGVHLQRALVHLWLLFVPVGFLWAFMAPVLRALGQEERLAVDVQAFLRILVFGAPGYIGFETLKKYLQCQGIMAASTFVLVAVSPVNAVLNVLFVHHTSLGLLGAPVALSITYWAMFALLVLFTCLSMARARNETWAGFDLAAVLDRRSSWTFLKLAVPGILMVGTEWAAFEIVALAAGRLGSLSLAAQSVIMTADQILNTIPFGIGVAASTRVGNLLGARSARAAKHAAHASALLSVLVGMLVMAVLIGTKDVFGYLFTDDLDVVTLVSTVMPLVASFQVADGLAGSCGGVLRGQGRQHLGALFNIVAYYVLALPMGITLAFRTNLGLQGLWIGQVVALFIVGIGEYAVVWMGTDWDEEVAKGVRRNKEEAKRRDAMVRDAQQ